MTTATIPVPIGADTETRRTIGTLNAELVRREAVVLGSRFDGTDWTVRFRAALAALWVQVHVQSTEATEGDVTAYDPVNFRTSTLVDCRAERIQDVVVTTLVPGERYVVFLIPVQYDGAGTKILYDGVGGPDNMSFANISV